jgi:hypothetical protein
VIARFKQLHHKGPVEVRMRATTIVLALLCELITHKASAQGFWVIGEVDASCGEYIQAADAERRVRPPGARPNTTYNSDYRSFMDVADGFLTGANYIDSDSRTIGSTSDHAGRMAWLDKYCRDNPLDKFAIALIALRTYLKASGK